MTLFGTRHVLAFDAGSVAAGAVSRGLRGPRIRGLARRPLTPGALLPSAFEANLARADEVRDALAQVVDTLALRGRSVCVVLPDGLARIALLESRAGVEAERFARFRLLPGLPYPGSEAIVDALPLPGRRMLAAAVRRSIVEEYEQAARAVGLVIARVDLAPLAAVAALRRDPAGAGRTVDVILGDAAYSLVAWHSGLVRVFRNRRRDAGFGESDRLRDEIARTAALSGDGGEPRVRVVGPGAAALLPAFVASGSDAAPGWRLEGSSSAVDGAELAWLGGALA